jgi:hypothetical protein
MFSRSHRSRNNKAQGFFARDQESKTAEAQRSLLAELGLISSSSSTARSGGRSSRRTEVERRPNDYASSTASARSYGIASYPEKSKAPPVRIASLSPLCPPPPLPLFAHFLLCQPGEGNWHPTNCVATNSGRATNPCAGDEQVFPLPLELSAPLPIAQRRLSTQKDHARAALEPSRRAAPP